MYKVNINAYNILFASTFPLSTQGTGIFTVISTVRAGNWFSFINIVNNNTIGPFTWTLFHMRLEWTHPARSWCVARQYTVMKMTKRANRVCFAFPATPTYQTYQVRPCKGQNYVFWHAFGMARGMWTLFPVRLECDTPITCERMCV